MDKGLLDRYLNGDRKTVWYELINHNSESFEEGKLIIDEIMIRSKKNLQVLKQRLNEYEGFAFLSDEENILSNPVENTPKLMENLQEMLSAYGYIPYSVKKYYETIGGVDFSGNFILPSNKIGMASLDPLVMIPLDSVIEIVKARLSKSQYNGFDCLFRSY